MITKVLILSRQQTADIKPYIMANAKGYSGRQWSNVFCISINGTVACEGIEAQPLFSHEDIFTTAEGRILHLEFDDIFPDTVARNESCKDMKFMSRGQASDVIFMLKKWNAMDGDNLLVVHCQAGICRSGAVGKFAGWLFNIEEKVLEDNKGIAPNKWVENLLYAVYKGI